MSHVILYLYMKTKIQWSKLLVAVLGTHAAGVVGILFTEPALATWYSSLVEPALSPPSWVFGPVWLTLYTLMGIAVYLIWTKRGSKSVRASSSTALTVYWVHMILNGSWSIAFFGNQNITVALAIIVVMLAFIVLLMKLFWKIDRRATYLFAPYLAWVTFATYLNWSYWILN